MTTETQRIMIEDSEDNFLYLNVRSSLADAELLLEIINNRSNGKAKLAGWAGAIDATVSQWHATAELNGEEIELTIYKTTDPGPMKEWKPAHTILIDDAHATELLGTLALALERKRAAGGVNAELVHAGLRDGLETSADVDQAYQLAQVISDEVNARLNKLADRKELTVATSLLVRAFTARALLLVAGDWWADMGQGPGPAYHAALRSFVDQAPAGYADRSAVDAEGSV
jgi:hypothetical protein